MRNLRKPPAARQGRLKNDLGELASSEERAKDGKVLGKGAVVCSSG